MPRRALLNLATSRFVPRSVTCSSLPLIWIRISHMHRAVYALLCVFRAATYPVLGTSIHSSQILSTFLSVSSYCHLTHVFYCEPPTPHPLLTLRTNSHAPKTLRNLNCSDHHWLSISRLTSVSPSTTHPALPRSLSLPIPFVSLWIGRSSLILPYSSLVLRASLVSAYTSGYSSRMLPTSSFTLCPSPPRSKATHSHSINSLLHP